MVPATLPTVIEATVIGSSRSTSHTIEGLLPEEEPRA
jgi:hypothetical protein